MSLTSMQRYGLGSYICVVQYLDVHVVLDTLNMHSVSLLPLLSLMNRLQSICAFKKSVLNSYSKSSKH